MGALASVELDLAVISLVGMKEHSAWSPTDMARILLHCQGLCDFGPGALLLCAYMWPQNSQQVASRNRKGNIAQPTVDTPGAMAPTQQWICVPRGH